MLGLVLGVAFLVIVAILLLVLRKAKKAGEDLEELGTIFKIAIVIMLLVGPIFILTDCYATVDAGHTGVLSTFGDVSSDQFEPGIHLRNPFTDVVQYSIQTLQTWEMASVPSKEGLIVTLDVTVLYKIVPNKAYEIHKTLGKNYQDTIIVSYLRSITREITAKYEAKALYTIGRENITREIFDNLEPILVGRGIILESVLLRDLDLPDTVTSAIEQKLKAEQEAQQMQFVLQKESMEAERKRVEAKGIADSQAIIDQSLTPEYLKWYWITHLHDHNSVIYVPIGTDGFPLVKMVE